MSSSARLQFVAAADELSLGAQLMDVVARKHIGEVTIAMTGRGRSLFFAVPRWTLPGSIGGAEYSQSCRMPRKAVDGHVGGRSRRSDPARVAR